MLRGAFFKILLTRCKQTYLTLVFPCAFRRRGETVRCGEVLSVGGFPDLRKVPNPKEYVTR